MKSRASLYLLFFATWVVPAMAAPPDALVVCPREFREALGPWLELRRSQGRELEIIDPPQTTAELKAAIRRAAASGRLEYLVLIGDAPGDAAATGRSTRIPTDYVPAKINVRWGSEPSIASDNPLADTNEDGVPDLAVGRIPADTPEELAAVVRKIIRYENRAEREPWDRQLSAVAGVGGFGALADAMIEAAGQQILSQALPAGYLVALSRANTANMAVPMAKPIGAPRAEPRARAPFAQQMCDGCLVWVYLGHGLPTRLDEVAGPHGPESILSVEDVPQLRCGARCPLAVLVACYTGAFDASRDCLGEELVLAEEGPLAVIAATRVSMPYGNTIFGYELLRASLSDRPATLGAAFKLAQQRTLAPRQDDPLRKSLDTMAKTLSPLLQRGGAWQPEDLTTERREHVAMYQLLGDPLLGWRRPLPMKLSAPAEIIAGQTLMIEGLCDLDGECVVELCHAAATPDARHDGARPPTIATATQTIPAGSFKIALEVPAGASGQLALRAYLYGGKGSALGGTTIVVRAPADEAAASKQP